MAEFVTFYITLSKGGDYTQRQLSRRHIIAENFTERMFRHIAGLSIAATAFTLPSHAKQFSQALIKNIIQGNEVYINRQQAKVNSTAKAGQTLSTGNSRAELLFDKNAIGFLGQSSLITLGSDCYKLQSGKVLVNGNEPACIGSKILGVRGTTYVLSAMSDDTYTLSVLNGEAVIGSADEIPKTDATDILSLYPAVNTIVELNASTYANNAGGEKLGGASGLILGGVDAMIPLSQSQAKSIFYSNSFANANFNGFWGATSEVGYQWYNPISGAIKGVFVGYDGYEQPGCFHSQIALGANYQFKSRWSIGANGGVKVDECPSSSSYASLQVTAPIGQIGDNSIELALSPYIVTGLGDDFAGGRASIEIPINSNATVSAYGQYDGLFNTTIGGMISYRFGLGSSGSLINDPNRVHNRGLTDKNNGQDLVVGTSRAEYIKAGEQAIIDSNGNILSKSLINSKDYEQIVVSMMEEQNPLPEGVSIYETYKRLYSASNNAVMSATGAYAINRFTQPYPRMRGANNLFIPQNRLPQKANKQSNPSNQPGPGPGPGPSPNVPDNTPTEVFVFGGQ